jgi:DNA polymerase III sliding clamp (beta) subunit (PCNA family)
VRFSDGRASLAGNGIAIHADCPGNSDSPFLAPYESLQRIASSCSPASEIVIAPRANGCLVQATGDGKWLLVADPVYDWSDPFEERPESPVFRLPVDEFLRAARATVFAVDKRASTTLSCELIDVRDGEISFVGSDGRRVATSSAEVDQAVDDGQYLVPGGHFELLLAVAAKAHEDSGIQLESSGKYLRATFDDCEVFCPLGEGSYMSWRKLFDKERPAMSEVRSGTLSDSLRRASVCVSENSHGVRLLLVDKAAISIEAKSLERGTSTTQCPIENWGGDGDATINPKFLDEWLRCNESDEPVSFDLGTINGSPSYFECDERRYLLAKIAKD